jgi:hypothetical protein
MSETLRFLEKRWLTAVEWISSLESSERSSPGSPNLRHKQSTAD